jgi:exodeoxyribonuclease VIII
MIAPTMTAPAALDVGIYRDLPMAEYLALPFMSASKLLPLRRSPLQYRHALQTPQGSTDALDRGTALHMAVLEPLLFEGHYTVAEACMQPLGKKSSRPGEPCGTRGLLLHRDLGWLCGVHVKGCGDGIDTSREILTADNYASVIGMRNAILAHDRARSLFEGKGEFEVTIVFDDPETGIRCKCRPDRYVARASMLVDIKSSFDAAPSDFPRLAENRGYFHKLAFYRRGLRAVEWPLTEIAVLAVEPDAPHDLAPYLIEDMKDLDAADADISRLLRVLRQCEDNDRWPGYAASEDGFLMLRRPKWAEEGNNG